MQTHILIVDDDPHIRELLRLYLQKERFIVVEAADGNEASKLLEIEQINLAIVDVMMPGKNGWELCEEIRKYYDIPVILLTARGEMEDKAKGFLSGTDDYVVKPFEPEELLFRVRALLRRYQMVSDNIITMNNTVIDRNNYEVKVNGRSFILPLKEFQLLAQLASGPDRMYTREQLIQLVWGTDFEGDSRTVDVHIKRLRERFRDITDDFQIVTIRGLGYKLEVKSE
ncbi:response regulator transcription factor [Lederbergia wuyishanensis]|uniref:Heme response regulator HssR n=1 Tax=Lederbergia wuyishanensis TaxID=1347903 RepID=A0ABU0D5I7_9BACI|nr:response regulator transcription factor [Lederbergia wuyishanensis]MCJ8009814.1 response regulator transcription factor [Lederbergia wuyishanensis]MDQ0343670.1 DNA-binding response OmpR family regulator [Lederbergia wuyishanensis]